MRHAPARSGAPDTRLRDDAFLVGPVFSLGIKSGQASLGRRKGTPRMKNGKAISEEQLERIRQRDILRGRAARAAETPDAREQRLEKSRVYGARRRHG